MSGDDALLTLVRSKTSQEDAVELIVERETGKRAFAEIERWVKEAGIQPGTPLIRSLNAKRTVHKQRLTDEGVHKAIRSCVYRHYLRNGSTPEQAAAIAKDFSGHSLRVGFIVTCKEAGVSDSDIMAISRHMEVSMIVRYSKTATLKRRSPHRNSGVRIPE
ncbi:MAG: hypothetical protein JXQ99_16605 [Hyphomicrobiaceae bacterium]